MSRPTYHATLMRLGLNVDCMELSDQSDELALALFAESGLDMAGTVVVWDEVMNVPEAAA